MQQGRRGQTLIGHSRAKHLLTYIFREAALAAIKVNPEDVKTVMTEFELGNSAAKRAIQENGGDLVQTLRALLA